MQMIRHRLVYYNLQEGRGEMSTRMEFGGSLPVPNVQAFASQNSGDIPPLRYVRPELHSEEVLLDESLQIPIIDMRKLMLDDDDEMEKLHFACKDWGFFQVITNSLQSIILCFQSSYINFVFGFPESTK